MDIALNTLKTACNGEFLDFWQLAGGSRAKLRKAVMESLTGKKEVAAKCGVNRLENEFFTRYNITGECPAERTKNFRAIVNQ